ncbi:low temperature requirement protein A [Micromonospora sp. NPDC049366]|uniref:low temperature requirement protein A n=1 Tax=Micromonospora sp. NPDC049366 TaxID=3364271 RepID=UPI003798D4A7
MASRPERLLRRREDPASATFLELFFDLAFVLVLSQLASALLDDLTGTGALKTALLLAATWWMWTTTTWSTDWYTPNAPTMRSLVIAAALATLLMGAAVPAALGGRALLFAIPYVALHVGRVVITSLVLRRHPLGRRSKRILFWYSISGTLWVAGAVVPAVRVPLWLTALAIDYSGPSLGWPTPRLGPAHSEELQLTGGHLSERFQQVFIIALGELVLSAGLTYADTPIDPMRTAAFLLVFATAVLIGLLYTAPAGRHLGPAIDRADPSRLAPITAYLHLVMVAGLVVTAVGAELVITHPLQPGPVAVVAAGPTLFLAARVLLSLAIYRRLAWPRLAAVPVMAVATILTVDLPLLVGSATATAILGLVVVLDRATLFGGG